MSNPATVARPPDDLRKPDSIEIVVVLPVGGDRTGEQPLHTGGQGSIGVSLRACPVRAEEAEALSVLDRNVELANGHVDGLLPTSGEYLAWGREAQREIQALAPPFRAPCEAP